MKFIAPFLALIVSSTVIAEGNNLTTLRVVEKPKIAMVTGRRQASLHVEAVVRNVGDFEAEAISVSAVLPDGSTVALSGPKTLKRNEKQTYTGMGQNVLVDPTKVRLTTECRNCRN